MVRPGVTPLPCLQFLSDNDRLTPDQAEEVARAVGPMVGYLWRLLEHMDRTNLSHRDPNLARLVREARDAVHALLVELHYQSCGHGVGRKPAKDR